ncbi:solute carrier family 46 member 2 isoform 1-T1 [Aulostomus maculatus]
MVIPGCDLGAFAVLRQVETVIVLEQLGSTLFDTALQMVIRDRCANASYPDSDISREDSQQRAMSDFYMTYNLILKLTPIVPALLLSKAGDRGWRRVPIAVPLCGYLLSRLALLLVVCFSLPVKVMFGAAVVFGLSGGFCTYWPGVMTLASLGSSAEDRSKVMMRVELLYGAAGLVGSLLSGHLFQLYTPNLGHGTILLIISTVLHLLSLVHATVLLQVRQAPRESEDNSHLISPIPDDAAVETCVGINRINVFLLFSAATLYVSSVGGAMEILGFFVMREPLNWNAVQVGYQNAAGCIIFFTSYLGFIALRRCLSDVTLVLIGMLSFASGIYFMSFVTATYMFYLARLLTLFSLIPMPTIRSLLSQQVPASSCGITLTLLQLVLKFAGLAYIPAFTKIYQRSLNWFPGFVFTLASVFSVLALIPVSIVGCRLSQKQLHEKFKETEGMMEEEERCI